MIKPMQGRAMARPPGDGIIPRHCEGYRRLSGRGMPRPYSPCQTLCGFCGEIFCAVGRNVGKNS